jgi:hypothetical protein
MVMLGSVLLFASLGKARIRLLADSAQEGTFRAGEPIVPHGEKRIGYYLILAGDAHVERAGRRSPSRPPIDRPGRGTGEPEPPRALQNPTSRGALRMR